MLKIIEKPDAEKPEPMLDEIAREGARAMLALALKAETASYLDRHKDARDEDGRALVVRNGTARARKVTISSDPSPLLWKSVAPSRLLMLPRYAAFLKSCTTNSLIQRHPSIFHILT